MNTYWKRKIALGAALASMAIASTAQASILWNWSFQGEAGTFTTSGTAPGNVAAAGNYVLEDFSVTASAFGNAPGSLLGGQYSAGGSGATLPYDFNWSGSGVTFWNMAGTYPSDVWLFNQNSNSNRRYIFGADDESPQLLRAVTFNLNTASYGPVTVSVQGNITGNNSVPEPAAWMMMIIGFSMIGASLRRRSGTLALANS